MERNIYRKREEEERRSDDSIINRFIFSLSSSGFRSDCAERSARSHEPAFGYLRLKCLHSSENVINNGNKFYQVFSNTQPEIFQFLFRSPFRSSFSFAFLLFVKNSKRKMFSLSFCAFRTRFLFAATFSYRRNSFLSSLIRAMLHHWIRTKSISNCRSVIIQSE